MSKRLNVVLIAAAVTAVFVLTPYLFYNQYSKQQERIAEESAHRVERALKQLDDDEAAKRIRAELVNAIGEFDNVVEVHWYAHPLPNYAYIHGTASKDGTRYSFAYFLKNDRISLQGVVEEFSDETTSADSN